MQQRFRLLQLVAKCIGQLDRRLEIAGRRPVDGDGDGAVFEGAQQLAQDSADPILTERRDRQLRGRSCYRSNIDWDINS